MLKTSPLIAAFFMLAAAAPAAAWSFSVGEEDWGQTCSLSADAEDGKSKLTFLQSLEPGSPLVMLVSGADGLPNEFQVTWQVDANASWRFVTNMDDYFGEPMLMHDASVEPSLYKELSSGSRLTLTLPGKRELAFDLQGSSRPLKAFRECIAERKPERAPG